MKNNNWEQLRSMVDRHNVSNNYGLGDDEIDLVTEQLLEDPYAQKVAERSDTNALINIVIRSYRLGRESLDRLALRL